MQQHPLELIPPRKAHPKVFTRGFNLQLPFWSRVIFIDWNGVLCKDVFWFSILSNKKHPYHKLLNNATLALFHEYPDRVNEWMRGELTSEEIIKSLSLQLDRRYRSDFLARRLAQDIRGMKVQQDLLQELRNLAECCFIVLATDNMDCFIEQIGKIGEVTNTVDAVLCSSIMGILKGENTTEFFQPWLKAHNLTFKDSLLIDDDALNCKSFVASEGTAIWFQSAKSTIESIQVWLQDKKE